MLLVYRASVSNEMVVLSGEISVLRPYSALRGGICSFTERLLSAYMSVRQNLAGMPADNSGAPGTSRNSDGLAGACAHALHSAILLSVAPAQLVRSPRSSRVAIGRRASLLNRGSDFYARRAIAALDQVRAR